jgi:hypothetical protein
MSRRAQSKPRLRRRCSIMLPPMPGSAFPTQCESFVVGSGRCSDHHRDWRHAREAREIEALERRKKGLPIPVTFVGIRARSKPWPSFEVRHANLAHTFADDNTFARANEKRDRKAVVRLRAVANGGAR